MKQIKNKIIDLRWGMKAPIIFLRLFRKFVFMWWGKNNGKFEFRID